MRTREKERWDPVDKGYIVERQQGKPDVKKIPFSFGPIRRGFESITDEPNLMSRNVIINKVGFKTKVMKPCYHYKENVSLSKGSYTHRYDNGYNVSLTIPICPGPAELAFSDYTDPPLPDDFIARAFNNMKPKFVADFSVANFIYELRELGKMVPRINGVLGRLKSTKELSDAHLNYSFAIIPLLNDLEKMNESIVLYKLRYKQFIKKAQKPHVAHYREVSTPEPREQRPYTNYPVSLESLKITHRLASCTYVATMQYTYCIVGAPPPPDAKNMLKYLGIRAGATPQIIWNALPFSFIVDWLVSVSKWLSQFDTSAIDVNVVVLGFCVSSDIRSQSIFHMSGGSGGDHRLDHSSSLTISRHSYNRMTVPEMLGSPSVIEKFPVFDEYSGREQMLTISLLNSLRK